MGIIYITRHGETEWNAEGRIQGHTDVPLSERGREQAQMLARRLAGVRIDAAYSSDLSRAAETARVALGERDVPLAFTSDLREYNKGVFEGMTAAEYQRKFPHLFEASMRTTWILRHRKAKRFAKPATAWAGLSSRCVSNTWTKTC